MSSRELIEDSVCRNYRHTATKDRKLAADRYDAFDTRRKEAEAVVADEEDVEVLEKMAKDIGSRKKGTKNESS